MSEHGPTPPPAPDERGPGGQDPDRPTYGPPTREGQGHGQLGDGPRYGQNSYGQNEYQKRRQEPEFGSPEYYAEQASYGGQASDADAGRPAPWHQSGRPDQPDQPRQYGQQGQYGQANQLGQHDPQSQSGQHDSRNQYGQVSQPGQYGQQSEPAQNNQVSGPEQYGRAGGPTPLGQPSQPGQYGPYGEYEPPLYGTPGAPAYGDFGTASSIPPTVEFADMGRRLLAFLIDGVVQFAVLTLLGILLMGLPLSLADPDDPDTFGPVLGVSLLAYGLLALVFVLGYQIGMVALRGATVGKMVLGIRIVRAQDGTAPGWGAAILRWLIPILGSLVCGLGQFVVYLSPFFDSAGRNQGWHDMAASTVVIRV